MDISTSNIHLLPIRTSTASLEAQSSISTRPDTSSRSTSYENTNGESTIVDASDDPAGSTLSTNTTNENAALLKRTRPSSRNAIQIVWTWIRRRLPEGWRFGATIGAILSSFALIGNILVFIFVSISTNKNGKLSAVATIREGHCSDIERIQLEIHLVINVVSSLLLGASNYCMQCLSAPTRAEVNKAHKNGRYLDIGVSSLRNLWFIKGRKLACWCLLGLSSVPLHLIYNSTFFVSLNNNSYDIYFASQDFQNGKWFNRDLFTDSNFTNPEPEIYNLNEAAISPTDNLYWTHPSVTQKRIQRLGLQENGSVFERLENADCIEAYAKTPLSDRRTLVLVSSTLPRDNHQLEKHTILNGTNTSNNHDNCSTSLGLPLRNDTQNLHYSISCLENSSLYAITSYRSRLLPDTPTGQSLDTLLYNWFYWVCSQNDKYQVTDWTTTPQLCGEGHWQEMKSNASEWTVDGFKIDYCISERLDNGCKLNMAGELLIIVIIFNAIKAVTIALVVWKMNDEQLITIGDAAVSFIYESDPTTKGLCLYTRKDFYYSFHGEYRGCKAKPFKPEAKRRAAAVTEQRWISTVILTLVGLGVILGFLGYAITYLKTSRGHGDFQFLWDLGLGTVNAFTLIGGLNLPASGDQTLVLTVLIANLPQTLLSVLYLVINGLFTSLSLTAEWSRYANRRAALRVSKQRGKQRSTYFLQIPYRLAIPLMVFSSFLHWITSQSVFFSQIDAKDPTGAASKFAEYDGPTTCGYSPLGMIITSIAIFVLLASVVALGWRKLQPGMPVAGSSSLVIAAACHSPEGTSALLPVMWGAIPDIAEHREDGVQIGHCALSNCPVEPPIEGNLYA